MIQACSILIFRETFFISRACLHPALRGSLQASLFELRPDKSFARHTQTRLRQGYAAAGRARTFCLRDQASRKASGFAFSYDPTGRLGRPAEAKTVNRFAIIIKLMPKRHLKLLPGQSLSRRSLQAESDRPGKISLLSAYVCVCLWLKYIFSIAAIRDQLFTLINDSNSFGDDPYFFVFLSALFKSCHSIRAQQKGKIIFSLRPLRLCGELFPLFLSNKSLFLLHHLENQFRKNAP